MYFSISRGKGGGSCIRASEAQHLMTRVHEFLNDGGADEACSSGDKNMQILFSLPRPIRVQLLPKLTSHCDFDKTELVSASVDYRRISPVASFLRWRRNILTLPAESRAPTRCGIANAFWRWPRRRSHTPAQTLAWMISPSMRAWGRELCIATFLP